MILTPTPVAVGKYCDQRICLCVTVSILENTQLEFHQIFCIYIVYTCTFPLADVVWSSSATLLYT